MVAPLVFSGIEGGSSGLRVEVDEERPKPLVRGARWVSLSSTRWVSQTYLAAKSEDGSRDNQLE